jgi:hypothetical protein
MEYWNVGGAANKIPVPVSPVLFTWYPPASPSENELLMIFATCDFFTIMILFKLMDLKAPKCRGGQK